jgi:ATP-dependent Lon protease
VAEAFGLPDRSIDEEREAEVLMRSATGLFDQYVKLNKKIPPEVLTSMSSIDDPSRLADTMAAHMALKLPREAAVLEIPDVRERLEHLMGLMEGENDAAQDREAHPWPRQAADGEEPARVLPQRADEGDPEGAGGAGGGPQRGRGDAANKIERAGMTKEAKKKAQTELNKLKLMSPMSAEATVVRNYLDALVNVPWNKRSKIRNDLKAAEAVLEKDHYGLEKVKERIIEYLAVQQRVRKLKGPILCLVGPPGVGKTSVGQSIARATNRKFVRMALGGVRDEAEIRGHRRTYIGALPGKIIQNLSKVGSRNPLFLLDEIDKMSMDFRGDPGLGPAGGAGPGAEPHLRGPLPGGGFRPLRGDVRGHRQHPEHPPGPAGPHGGDPPLRLHRGREGQHRRALPHPQADQEQRPGGGELQLSEGAIRDIIRYYTREAGVRNLEREISKICRKVVKEVLLEKKSGKKVAVNAKNLEKYLGVKRFRYGRAEENDQVGQVTGLAWTEVGGELLHIEATVVPGKGNLKHTGKLGEVMQESIQAAMTVVRSRSPPWGWRRSSTKSWMCTSTSPKGRPPRTAPAPASACAPPWSPPSPRSRCGPTWP